MPRKYVLHIDIALTVIADKPVDIVHLVNELDYNFTTGDTGCVVSDMEVRDWKMSNYEDLPDGG